MKIVLRSFLAIHCLLFVASLTAAPESPAKGHRVSAIEQPGHPAIAVGTAEFTVRRLLGEPARKLAQDTWVYADFRAVPETSPDDHCRTLVVTFNAGKVADIKLVNDRAEKVIVAQLNARPAPKGIVAATKPSSATQ